MLQIAFSSICHTIISRLVRLKSLVFDHDPCESMMPGVQLPAFLVVAVAVSTYFFPAVVTAFVNPVGGRSRGSGLYDCRCALRPQCVFGTTIRPLRRLSSRHKTNNFDSPNNIDTVSDPSNQHGPREDDESPIADDRQSHTGLQTVSASNSDSEIAGTNTSAESNDENNDAHQYPSFLDELLLRCAEATRPGAAMESPHTGSSEWAGFRTTKCLLDVSLTAMLR